MTKASHEDVARKAYELFLARGAAHGLALEDWLEAERQLTRTAPSRKKTTTR
jgi:Protein of unknown function (DUF2934)